MPEVESLLEQARQAARNAYAPASGFRVGAAIAAEDGRVFTGVNIENASYGLSICAERVALFKAISEGARGFTELAVVAGSDAGEEDAPPCGACRQVLLEFGPDMVLLMAGSRGVDGQVKRFTVSELVPEAFSAFTPGSDAEVQG